MLPIHRLTSLASLAAFTLVASPVAAAGATSLTARQDPKLGTILQSSAGMTLYLYTKDEPGVSNCYDQCAAAWPPVLASTLPDLPANFPGKLSLVARKDGTRQVAYNGWPLYGWVRDTKPGDTTGQGVGKVWYALNPGPTLQTAALAKLGNTLVAANGMTLYLFTKDTKDVSNCYDQCAVAWPPLLTAYTPTAAAAPMQAHLGTTTRKDGALQVTYDGKPLYFWVNDKKPGDATGQNVGKVWFVIKP